MPNEIVVHVVDDDLAVRQSLAFLLASDGIPVCLHESALSFLEAMPDAVAGCIVTDPRPENAPAPLCFSIRPQKSFDGLCVFKRFLRCRPQKFAALFQMFLCELEALPFPGNLF